MVLALALLPSYLVVIMKWDQLVQGKLLTLLLDIVFLGGGLCAVNLMGLGRGISVNDSTCCERVIQAMRATLR